MIDDYSEHLQSDVRSLGSITRKQKSGENLQPRLVFYACLTQSMLNRQQSFP